MADAEFHVAQFNVSRLLAPLDEPLMREFVAFLGPVNAFADKSPGFDHESHRLDRSGVSSILHLRNGSPLFPAEPPQMVRSDVDIAGRPLVDSGRATSIGERRDGEAQS